MSTPIGGVTPATGVTGGPAPCGCPNVIADEVRYPSGNSPLQSCQPAPYEGQLPGYSALPQAPVEQAPPMVKGASVYDPLASVTDVSDVMIMPGAYVTGLNLGYGYGQNSRTTPGQSMPWYLVGAQAGQHAGSASGPSSGGAVETIKEAAKAVGTTVTSAVSNVTQSVTQFFTPSSEVSGAAVNLGPVMIPTSVDEVRRPFQDLAGKLGLVGNQSARSGAAVNLGPLSIPTTGGEWQLAFTGINQQLGIPGAQAAPANPLFLERIRHGWKSIRPRFLSGGAQAGSAEPGQIVIDVPGTPNIRVRGDADRQQEATRQRGQMSGVHILALIILAVAIGAGVYVFTSRRKQ